MVDTHDDGEFAAASAPYEPLVSTRGRLRALAATVACCDARIMSIRHRPDSGPHHPAVAEDLREHAERLQGSIADLITRDAGSMLFVYVHIAIFAIWMLLLERSPWPTLTLVVSLEAIFLSRSRSCTPTPRSPRSSKR